MTKEAEKSVQSKPVTRCKALIDRRNHVKILHLSTMWFVHQEEKETFKQTSSDTGQLDFAFSKKNIFQNFAKVMRKFFFVVLV